MHDTKIEKGTSVPFATLSVFPSLICGSCPSGQRFAYSFFQIPSHGGHPCCSAMCFVVAYAHSGLSPVRERPCWANKRASISSSDRSSMVSSTAVSGSDNSDSVTKPIEIVAITWAVLISLFGLGDCKPQTVAKIIVIVLSPGREPGRYGVVLWQHRHQCLGCHPPSLVIIQPQHNRFDFRTYRGEEELSPLAAWARVYRPVAALPHDRRSALRLR